MKLHSFGAWVSLAFLAVVVIGAPKHPPHPHNGILPKYDRKHPSKYGVSLKGVTLEQLRSGKPLLRLLSQPNGFKRTTAIQDIEAPPDVVFGRICDWKNYPRMIRDVKRCDVYKRGWTRTGSRYACANYKISVPAVTLDFYVEHVYDPLSHCMSFQLDYTRKSDVADQVGYWYVERLGDGWSRLYYSTDFQIPRWVPPFAKGMLLKLAAKSSVEWVLLPRLPEEATADDTPSEERTPSQVAVESMREMAKRKSPLSFRLPRVWG